MEKEQSRLCCLIDHYLSPYTKTGSASLTKEMAKELLIALSQVYKETKRWMKEYESDDSFDMAGSSVGGGRILPESHAANHHCLTNVIEVLLCVSYTPLIKIWSPVLEYCYNSNENDLIWSPVAQMVVVATENPYIHHLVGNILVAVSDFLVESVRDKAVASKAPHRQFFILESCWSEYINLLYHCMKISVFNRLSSMGHTMEVNDLIGDPSPSPLLKLSLKSGSWSTTAVIMRVLHNVLKQLNRDLIDQRFNNYLEATTSFISNMPWDLLSEVYHIQGDSNPDHSLQIQEAKLKSVLIFQGYLLRLLCSLVKSGLTDTAVIASAEHPFIFEIKDLLPRLLSSCLSNGKRSENVAICQYLKHKMLMLMIRLSNQIHLNHSIVISWLDLIHTYFQDVLSQPMDVQEYGPDKYLEGSPFGVMTFDMGKKWISSKHLQRLAIFLFLKCSSSLLNMKETTDQHYACKNLKSCSGFDLNPKLCSRRKALLELHEWLGEVLPGDRFDHDMCSEKCIDFVSSFLQLYMQEDDILFEMLLQMFCLPFYSEKFTNEVALPDDEVREFSLISHLFHPIHFFHLFLAGIHYDHQVLLDYLISKDTGASSAEYLLRCLRKVCDSWNIFVEFSWSGKCRSRKRKKFSTDNCNSRGEISVVPSSVCEVILPLESKSKKAYGCRDEDYVTQISPFECARNCLFSLKASIQSLHQKNLFPYNPKVLLSRLMRFQELCGADEP